MRISGLSLAAVTFCALACSTDSLGVTDQREVEADLVGSWSQVVTAREEQQVIDLTVNDTIVSGTGHWSGEAIAGGMITVSGHVTGSRIELILFRDDDTILPFSGHLASKNSLVGSFIGVDHPVSAQFTRVGVDPP